ncbi:MAG: NVEALA domain-containing protein [Candidatus Symbiothrix sp.]|jgi:hypothetical protein|nr:NVEALA domain-containing protein [Candidatus Symbiothrix sp.]
MTTKKIICGIAVLAIAAVAAVNVTKSNTKTTALTDIQLANVEALADNELSIPTGQTECQQNCGYWNMALVCADGGVESVTCTVKGELTVWNIKIVSASFEKGNSYSVAWERWECQNSTGNCCPYNEQGVRVLS